MTNLPSKMTERDLEQALENVLPIRADESALGFPVAQQDYERNFPMLQIDQGGERSRKMGTWRIQNVSLGEEIGLLWIRNQPFRWPFWSKYKPGRENREDATCISWDGENAIGYGPPEFHHMAPGPRECRKCPANQLDKREIKCMRKHLVLTFVDVQGVWSPSMFRVQGTAVKPTLKSMDEAKAKAAETYDVQTGRTKRPAYLFRVKASLQKVDGRYFIPVYGEPQPLTAEEALTVVKILSSPDIAKRWTDEIKHLHDKAVEIMDGKPAEQEPSESAEPTTEVDYGEVPF